MQYDPERRRQTPLIAAAINMAAASKQAHSKLFAKAYLYTPKHLSQMSSAAYAPDIACLETAFWPAVQLACRCRARGTPHRLPQMQRAGAADTRAQAPQLQLAPAGQAAAGRTAAAGRRPAQHKARSRLVHGRSRRAAPCALARGARARGRCLTARPARRHSARRSWLNGSHARGAQACTARARRGPPPRRRAG